MRTVYQAENAFDAHLVRHALEHAGIQAFVLGEGLTGGIGELPVLGYCRVVVADADVEAAMACIAAVDLGVAELADEDVRPAVAPAR